MLFSFFNIRINLKDGHAGEPRPIPWPVRVTKVGYKHASNPELEREVLLEMGKGGNHIGNRDKEKQINKEVIGETKRWERAEIASREQRS